MNQQERQSAIRQHFEVERDIGWKEDLEPKFQVAGVTAEGMKKFRKDWNAHTEAKDWAWWQEESARYSDGELHDLLMDTIDRANALGLRQWGLQDKLFGQSTPHCEPQSEAKLESKIKGGLGMS